MTMRREKGRKKRRYENKKRKGKYGTGRESRRKIREKTEM